jgi:predicted component of type VI protein secretion system
MQERMKFSFELGSQAHWNQSPDHTNGLTVIILGAFDGRAETFKTSNENTPSIHRVDIDSLDELIAKLQPSITLSLDIGLDHPQRFRFASLEDFHPDRLIDQLPAFGPESDSEVAPDSDQQAPIKTQGAIETESEQDTLSRLLGQRPLSVEQRKVDGSTLSTGKKSVIKEVVRRMAENASVTNETKTSELHASEDHHAQNQARLLRHLLHNETFQALESSWRALDWLIHSTEPDPAIRFYILNMTRAELENERLYHEVPTTSILYHKLRDLYERDGLSSAELILLDQHPYALNQDEIGALDWLGSLVANFDGGLLAGTDSSFSDAIDESDDTVKAWHEFRQQTTSARIALLYPQVLLRLPYGSQTDPIDSFDFEELDDACTNDELLWGNPTYALLILKIRRLIEQGNEDQATLLTDLPAYTYTCEGESRLQPCTKILLREPEVDRLLKLGLVPVIGSPKSNIVQIPCYQYLGLAASCR